MAIMRLLLTFLALLTGFSAAEAARPVAAASPTSAATQIEPVDVFATASVICAAAHSVHDAAPATVSAGSDPAEFSPAAPVATTPVSRAERARE